MSIPLKTRSWNPCISKHASAKSQTKVPRGSIRKTLITKTEHAQNDHGDAKYRESSRGRRSAASAPIVAILVLFESTFSAEHFPTAWKKENYLEPALLWVSRNVRPGPWLAHQVHVMKCAPVIGQFACLLSRLSFSPSSAPYFPSVVCSVPSRTSHSFALRCTCALWFISQSLSLWML